MKKITFNNSKDLDFASTLKQRVNKYFKSNEIARSGNISMAIKVISLLLLTFVPFIVLISGVVTHFNWLLGLYIMSAFGAAGVGMSVMHDANHNSLSGNQRLNKILGKSLNLIGGNSEIWKFQHNTLHHTFTNILEADEDINPPFFLRFSPDAKKLKIHRFQHLYAWFFYGLSTISWAISTDFTRLKRYKKLGLVKTKQERNKLLIEIIAWKMVYFSYTILLPLIMTPSHIGIGSILLGFFIMHFIIGVVLTFVFQLAHVVPDAHFPTPNENGSVENNWFIHQLETTCNFAPESKVLAWYIGGLNYQIEHHLFPNICHIHYKALSKITKETASEFNIPYYSTKTFLGAVKGHLGMLKDLGKDSPNLEALKA